VAIVRGLPRFDRRASFTTWSYRVTTNACLDELRRRRRRPQPVDLQLSSDRARVPGLRPATTADQSPAAAHDDQVAAHLDVSAALSTLAPEFRAAVVLRDLCGLAYDQIAAVLEVPVGTVRSRIARGRAALVPLLQPRPATSSAEGSGNARRPVERQIPPS
jgi:RNA polymerase sigma-70 factor (ECF subfamily)